MKIADEKGVVIKGLYRSPSNGIVVNDPEAYTKYKMERDRVERLNKLESDVSDIKSMLQQLLNNGKTNI